MDRETRRRLASEKFGGPLKPCELQEKVLTRRCPYTEQCKAKAQSDFAAFPELLAVFDKDECSTRKPSEQTWCAEFLGLKEV